MNNNIEQLRNNLVAVLNNAQVSPGVAYYVLKDVLNELGTVYKAAIQEELSNVQKEQKQEIKVEEGD